MDDFMNKFIEKCTGEGSQRVVEEYSIDCFKIIENTDGNGLVPFERIDGKPKEWICGVKDRVLAEQELMIEDFYGTEVYLSLNY